MTTALRTAKLGEIAELNPRLADALESDATVSFVPMSSVSAETASTVDVEERRYEDVSTGYTPFLDGDLLVAKITPCFENGKIAQAKLSHHFGFGSTEFHVVRPLTGKADSRYLLQFLRQERVRKDGERKMTGSAGQRRVPEHFLAGLEVPIPSITEQRRIAEVLDRAEALRVKRRAGLAQLDTLIQSLFLDLFGDPVANRKGLPISQMGAVCDVRDGTHDSPEYVSNGGYPLVTSKNLSGGSVDLTDVSYISETDYIQINKRSKVDLGDIIMPMIGTIGSPVLVDQEPRYAIKNVALIKFTETSPSAVFVRHLLSCHYFDHIVGRTNRGGTQKFISLGDLRAFPLPLPSGELQREFAHRVAAVEKLKTAYHASLAELSALFAALEHRAFRGEL